jgi:hypothetical protein
MEAGVSNGNTVAGTLAESARRVVSETGKAERNEGRAVASSAEATTPHNVQAAIWSVNDKAKIFIPTVYGGDNVTGVNRL